MNTFPLWDAHAHIQTPWFTVSEIAEILTTSKEQGIEGIINVVSSPTPKDYEEGLNLASHNEMVHTNFGLQPTEASDKTLALFKEFTINYKAKLCAIGEVGLDYYWVKDQGLLDKQIAVFKECISIANDLKLPLVVHSRKAEDDCLDLLEKLAIVPVLMHGMEATEAQSKRLIDLDYRISIPTSMCNRKKYKKIALRMPIELILLETDSPFQLPFNVTKGERVKNSPANITLSAKKLAELKELSLEEIARITSATTKTFFGLR